MRYALCLSAHAESAPMIRLRQGQQALNGLSADSLGIHIAGYVVGWYPLVVIAAIGGAALIASRLALLRSQTAEQVWRGLVWVIPFAVLGGRFWFVLFRPASAVQNGFTAQWMLTHFFDLSAGAIAIWSGGLGLIGAVAGGVFGLALYAGKTRLPLLPFLDIAAVSLPFAQAIARLGNGISQNLYGPPADIPWGMLVTDAAQRVPPYTNLTLYPLETTHFHPVYLYAMLLAVLVFAILFVGLVRFFLVAGQIGLLYGVLYGAGGFVLEFMGGGVWGVGDVKIPQAVEGLAAIIAAAVLIKQRKGHRHIVAPDS